MRKIKWDNVIITLILLACIVFISKDIYLLTIHSWVTSEVLGWTWWGVITFIMGIIVGNLCFDALKKEIKNTSKYQPRHTRMGK